MGRIIAGTFLDDVILPFDTARLVLRRSLGIVYVNLTDKEERIVDVIAFMRGNRAYFEDFITRSTYHSNAIEGSTLSYAETYAILWNDNSLQVTATARELY